MGILWNYLPDKLFTRVKITNSADINAFFIALKDTWLEQKPFTFIYNRVSEASYTNASVPIILSNTIPTENQSQYKKALDHLDFIAQRLGYPDDASCDPNALDNFIKKELYNRLGYMNFNIQSKKLYAAKNLQKLRKKLLQDTVLCVEKLVIQKLIALK